MDSRSKVVSWAVGLAVWAAAAPVQAQSNLDAGKSPAQIFAGTCNACHRSPREIRRTNAAFLREHYTTGAREAAAMAAYLASVGSDPDAVRQRRPPTLGAGQAPAGETTTARAPATGPAANEQSETGAGQAGGEKDKAEAKRPWRPAESIELGLPTPSAAADPGISTVSPRPALPGAARASSRSEIEE
ncbi:MAG TPA: hypothetical protein VGH39_08055 [Xanthobacteraceae bacterium]